MSHTITTTSCAVCLDFFLFFCTIWAPQTSRSYGVKETLLSHESLVIIRITIKYTTVNQKPCPTFRKFKVCCLETVIHFNELFWVNSQFSNKIILRMKSHMVAYSCNSSSREVEKRGSCIQVQHVVCIHTYILRKEREGKGREGNK